MKQKWTLYFFEVANGMLYMSFLLTCESMLLCALGGYKISCEWYITPVQIYIELLRILLQIEWLGLFA